MFRKYILIFMVSLLLQIIAKVEALSCYQCNSNEDEKCIYNLKDVQPKTCGEDESLKYCVTSVANGIVTRACSKNECSTSDCRSTQTDNGNTHNICQTCNSSDDVQCAQSSVAVDTINKVCETENTKCVISIKDKNTERRCATADDEKICTDTDTSSCKSCTGSNCNIGIFPTNRLRCFQCDSSQTADAKCNTIDSSVDGLKAKVCQFYEKEDKCYTIGSSVTAMKRGCVSDSSEKGNKCTSTNSDDQCATCNKDECNNPSYMRDQTLKCVQCTTSSEDKKCSLEQNAADAKNCQNQILYNKEEMCYTETKGDTVQRGCLYDREGDSAKCESDTGCVTCGDSDGCNKNVQSSFTCIICRSDITPNCYSNADKITGSTCRNEATKDEQIGCFYGKWNGVVIRGCVADADERVQATCISSSNNQCIVCKESNCNNLKASAAAIVNPFTSLFILVIAFLLRQL